MDSEKYTLLTRSNFDGLVSAALLKEAGIVDKIEFVHPQDVQDGLVEVTDKHITTGLPYCENVYFAFDNHASEVYRVSEQRDNLILEFSAPSSSRLVYEYLNGEERFGDRFAEIVDAVDRADTTSYTKEDIVNPKGWVLLNYIVDPRTGLGRYKNFSVSNYALMHNFIDYLRTMTLDEILDQQDIIERIKMYKREEYSFKKQIKQCSRVKENVVVVDIRDENIIYAGNRFMVYALYPHCNISIYCMKGHNDKTTFAVGKSIINRSSEVDIAAIMNEYGGGGHSNSGSCQIENYRATDVLNELIDRFTI